MGLSVCEESEVIINMKTEIVSRLREFIENEGRSCSMDISGITPEYVYRMWGGSVTIEDIASALETVKKEIW